MTSKSSTSKKTLFSLLEVAKSKVLDINLRAPHYNRKIVQELLLKADFLKLNLAELELVTGWFSDYLSIDERIKSLSDRFQLSNIVITKGGDGATLYMDGETINHAGIKIDVVDTVGSGDAFLAGLLSKIIEGKTHSEALEYASGLGALIATKRGACPEYEINEVYKLISKQKTEV